METLNARAAARLVFAIGSLSLAGACARGASTASPEAMPAASASSSLPSGVTTAMIAVGDSIFHGGSCQRCHGPDAKGTARGPDLTDNAWAQIDGSYPQIVAIVTSGVPKEKVKMAGAPFGMRPRGGTNLTDEQVRQVAAYVFSVSRH